MIFSLGFTLVLPLARAHATNLRDFSFSQRRSSSSSATSSAFYADGVEGCRFTHFQNSTLRPPFEMISTFRGDTIVVKIDDDGFLVGSIPVVREQTSFPPFFLQNFNFKCQMFTVNDLFD